MKKVIVILAFAILFMVGAIVLTKKIEDYYGVDGDKLLAEARSEKSSSNVAKTHGSTNTNPVKMDVSGKDVEDKGGAAVNAPSEANTISITLKIDSKLTEEDWQKRKEAGLTGEAIDKVVKKSQGKYYFDNISQDLRQLYSEIYLVVTGRGSDVPLCSVSEDDIDKVFNCVMCDYPEIFYTNGYSYTRHLTNQVVTKIDFTSTYTFTVDEQKEAEEYLEAYYQKFTEGIAANASEYEKVKYTYEFIIINTEYNINAPDNQNLMSVAAYRESVCQGYTKMFQYLVNRLGVECTMCIGSSNGEGHSWNLVNVDNSYYYVDVTWGDASYNNAFANVSIMSEVIYDYLLVTTDEISKNHTFDSIVTMPRCVNTDCNYYVKEGLYFTSCDKDHLAEVFSVAKLKGNSICTVKCRDKFVFDEFKSRFIDDQEVFDCIPGEVSSLNYGINQESFTYTFILE